MAVVGTARPIKTRASTGPDRFVKYTSVFEVITDSVADGPITVCSASGLPQYNDAYSWGSDYDTWALANSVECDIRREDETRKLWTVTVNYETVGGDASSSSQDQGDKRGDPVDWRWEMSGDLAQFTRVADKDRNGAAILNGADEPFVPPPDKDDSRSVIILRKNTPTISLSQWSEYRDTVNGAAMWGLLRRQVKLNQWRWQVKYWGLTNAYIANEWHFHISNATDKNGNVIGWTGYYLNRGRRYVAQPFEVEPDKRYALFTDKHGIPLPEPGLLDGLGGKLNAGDPPTYITAEIEFEKDFTSIGIPDPLPGPFA